MNIDNIRTMYEYDIKFVLGEKRALQFFRHKLSEAIQHVWEQYHVFVQELEFDAWHLRATAKDSENLIRAVVYMEEFLKAHE